MKLSHNADIPVGFDPHRVVYGQGRWGIAVIADEVHPRHGDAHHLRDPLIVPLRLGLLDYSTPTQPTPRRSTARLLASVAVAVGSALLAPGIARAEPGDPFPPPPGTSESYQLGYENVISDGIKFLVSQRGPVPPVLPISRQQLCANELQGARESIGANYGPPIDVTDFLAGCADGISALVNAGYVR